MKVKLFSLFFLLLLTAVWTACNDDDDDDGNPAGSKYASGVFVVNEGPFGGTGTITWHNPQTGETEQDIFAANNNGAVLGQFAQSLTFHQDKAYVVVNGANRIVVADANTFQFQDTIGGLILPRFMLVTDDSTAWVTQWGAGGLDGSVAKVNLNTLQVLKTIKLGNGPEKIARDGDRLYIPNSGGFGVDSTVSVLNLTTETEETRIAVAGKNPCCVAFLFNTPYVLCRGSFLEALPTGYVVNLTTGVFNSTFPYGDDLVRVSDNTMRWTGGGSIWKHNGSSISGFFSQNAYGLGFDPVGNLLYCTDAGDFTSNGTAVVYDLDGNLRFSFATGVGPGEVVFR